MCGHGKTKRQESNLSVEAFRVWNFMGFEDSGWVELWPISLLFGRNSTGKSALLRALLLLRQSLTSPPSLEPLTLFSEDGIDAGSFQDLVHRKPRNLGLSDGEHGEDASSTVAFGFRCRINPELLQSFQPAEKRRKAQTRGEPVVSEEEAWATLRLGFGPEGATRCISLQIVEIRAPWLNAQGEDSGTLIFSAEWGQSDIVDGAWFFQSDLLKQHVVDPAFQELWAQVENFGVGIGFLPVLPERKDGNEVNDDEFESDYDIVRRLLDEFRQVISAFLKSLHYLGPVRAEPRRFYYVPSAMSSRARGQEMTVLENFLATWGTDQWGRDLEQVNTRLRELDLGIQLDVRALDEEREPFQSIFELRLPEDSTETAISLCDTGFGWSQMLPIVLECALAKEGAIVIIEEPEAHLHPSAQVSLGDLFVRIVKQGVCFLIETHSEHLLLRLRRRIARTTLNRLKRARGIAISTDGEDTPELALVANQLAVYFVEREAGLSQVEPIPVDEQGQYLKRPEGFKRFFSDDYDQVMLIGQDIAELNMLGLSDAGDD